MLERVFLALGLIAVGLLAYRLWVRWQLGRTALQFPGYRLGRPAILYFTTPGCLPCQTAQRPALAELVQQIGPRLQILEVDALQHPELADAWGVLSLPTTFLIDSLGRTRRVNHGVARAPRLWDQLAEIGELPAGALPTPEPAPEVWS